MTVGLLKLESKLKREWADVLLQEEILRMQKSRINKLYFGDMNTCFFHTSTLVYGGEIRSKLSRGRW